MNKNDYLKIDTSKHGGLFSKNFNWIASIDAWDLCDPKPLSEMINNLEIPKELRPVISNIISGKRQPNKKAASKLKLSAESRLLIASMIISLRVIPKTALRRAPIELADIKGVEPCELQRHYQKKLKEYDNRIIEITGLSLSSIHNLTTILKEKLKKYPDI